MDLNGFINTIISSTAALVAIIGGFLVSRVLTLSSEQTAIKRRMREINNDITAKQDMLKEAETSILIEDARDYLKYNRNYEKIIFEGKTSYEVWEETRGFRERTFDELEPYVAKLYQVEKDLNRMLDDDEKFRDFDEFTDFDTFIVKHEMELPHQEEWYDLLYTGLKRRIDKPSKRTHPSLLSKRSKWLDIIPKNNDLKIQAYRQKKRDRDTLKDELKILELQKHEQKKILQHYGKPKGIWWGLIVLI